MKVLDHPNIVKVYEIVPEYLEQEGLTIKAPAMIMEFVPKRNVHQFRKGAKFFPEKIARRIFVQMLDTLEYLHSKHSIVHHDIKLKNFIFDDDFNIKLCDFGVAGYFDPKTKLTDEKSKIGRYTLPDLTKKQKLYSGPDLDLFAAAICLYFMVTGVEPPIFKNEADRYSLLCSNAKLYWKSLRTTCENPDISEQFASLMNAMLAPEAKRRPDLS